tara:strand:- start:76 stop:294 length:219 start_codon:yes stop_codon:yes gene_type:complete
VQFIFNEMNFWILLTAVIFTYLGRYMAHKDDVQDIIETTIQRLIDQGYLKTKGQGDNLEILKYWEKDDQTSR